MKKDIRHLSTVNRLLNPSTQAFGDYTRRNWLLLLLTYVCLTGGTIACDSGDKDALAPDTSTNPDLPIGGQSSNERASDKEDDPDAGGTPEPSTDENPDPADPETGSPTDDTTPGDPDNGNGNDIPSDELPAGEIDACSGPVVNPIERPIIFVHGIRGKNDGFFELFGHLIDSERYEDAFLAGVQDHKKWHEGSVPCKRKWLFAFDYYANYASDTYEETKDEEKETFFEFVDSDGNPRREAEDNNSFRYTAAPGRIGSNGNIQCDENEPGDYLRNKNELYGYYIDNNGSVVVERQYARDLADFVDSVKRATGAKTVDIVAHSMGGLITRSYISYFGGRDNVDRALLVASPIIGNRFTTGDGLLPFLGSYYSESVCAPTQANRNILERIFWPWMIDNELQETTGSCANFSICNGEDSEAKEVSFGATLLAYEKTHAIFGAGGVELHTLTGEAEKYFGIVTPEAGCHPQECTTRNLSIFDLSACEAPQWGVCWEHFGTHKNIIRTKSLSTHMMDIGIGAAPSDSGDYAARCTELQDNFGTLPEACIR